MNPEQKINVLKMKLPLNRAEWTNKEELLDKEISCREMMISIFAYWGIGSIKNEGSFCFEQYLKKYLIALGRKRFDKIRDEMVAEFEKATVNKGVYEDHEGCTYNSIKWA